MKKRRFDNRTRSAFTLVEVITAVIIILILIAIVVPALTVSFRKARATRAAADLASIGMGLDAYRTDHGDYPRPTTPNTGFAVLAKALIAPGPAGGFAPVTLTTPVGAGTIQSQGTPGNTGYSEHVAFGSPDGQGGFGTSAAVTDDTQWASFRVSDGNDGPGFRNRSGGQKYGPYLAPEKFRTRGLAILDAQDNPILYFVARPQKPAQTPTGWPLLQVGSASLYNAEDNVSFFRRPGETLPTGNAVNTSNAMKRMDALMVTGASPPRDFDGVVEPQIGEQAVTSDKPFLLWSAGPDGSFGVTYDTASNPTADDIRKCDDVTNFTTGQ